MKARWTERRLESIGVTQTGSTPKTSEKENFGNFIPFIKPSDFNEDGSLNYINEGLSEIGLQRSRCVNAGSVLMVCIGATIGKCGWNDRAVTTNQQVNVLTLIDSVSHKFVYYQMLTEDFQRQVLSNSSQATLPIINKSKWSALTVCIPPTLPEQQRIVTILDEAFDCIAIAKANAEKNLRNARALFESHLQSVFSQQGEGWVEKKLSDVCTIISKLIDPRKDEFLDLIHVGAGNIVSQTGCFVDLKTAREEGLISGKFLFDETMVLYSKIRPYLMKVARPEFKGLCSADMYPLAPLPNKITRDYLFHLLLSKHFTDYAIQGSARAGMPKVNREHLFEFSVWLPPVLKQKELAEKLDALHEETQRLEAIYQQELAALDALKKSLLHQAFSGML